jgi:hypothetical protein
LYVIDHRVLVEIGYWLIAVGVSLFLGYHALAIHVEPQADPKDSTKPAPVPVVRWQHLWQQWWLNFVGAMVGWIVLWPLIIQYGPCLALSGCQCGAVPGWWAAFGALIAFLGITGYLPSSIILPIRGAVALLYAWLKKVV